ncbi:MAG: class I SAM-dependent methyltransferase, partial [Candidatus Eremiobacteraeota bacterium]|nr:class I SAM-dependent methyltransferase [Candidatus Eremiobacteraeota bacterium]
RGETFYPLHAYVCDACWLVQLDVFASPEELFRDYRYFSSYSTTWLAHAQAYAAEMAERGIGAGSRVVEVASNDGYLLRNFVARGVTVLGIEPASNVAAVAREAGIPTIDEFFGVALGQRVRAEFGSAHLIVANNVLAHVPDVNEFVGGFAALLAPDGLATFEFPHLLRTMAGMQFDTVYHEHFSYLSLVALSPLFARHGLEIVEVTELPTHGGSLRVFVAPRGSRAVDASVAAIVAAEREAGLERLETYAAFGARVARIKDDFVAFLLDAKRRGKRVAGYGAAAKATTLLNYAGVRADLIPYVADKSPHKQGHAIPGVRVPIVAPDSIRADRPDYVVIFPWNVEAEIRAELADVRDWGGRFVLAIPALRIDP